MKAALGGCEQVKSGRAKTGARANNVMQLVVRTGTLGLFTSSFFWGRLSILREELTNGREGVLPGRQIFESAVSNL